MKTATVPNVLHIQYTARYSLWLVKYTRIPSAVHFRTSPNHSLEILSITIDKCNSCQDFLHTKTDTVRAAKHFSPSSSPPLSVFTSLTNLSCSQICEISAVDYARLVAVDVRRWPIQSWPWPPELQPFSQHCQEETAQKFKIQPWCDWPSLLLSCIASSNLQPK